MPLRHAHDSGAGAWSAARKREYANDLAQPAHLIAVAAGANRSKGAKGPADWRPPNQAYWCQYATDWQAIKQQWGLRIDEREAPTPVVRQPSPPASNVCKGVVGEAADSRPTSCRLPVMVTGMASSASGRPASGEQIKRWPKSGGAASLRWDLLAGLAQRR